MTRRQFDALTRRNYGCRIESWLRRLYREQRHLPCRHDAAQRDRLAERAAWRRRNRGEPVLGLGSPLRAPAEWRLMRRLPRLPLTREELAALAR